ncbi:hypothetical protein GQ54DRAFT_130984 [Martensiomyces pterosporus]|nr:hypothetical protein GQ54DRAFT_130984 [Martensiomyces pterosporus]
MARKNKAGAAHQNPAAVTQPAAAAAAAAVSAASTSSHLRTKRCSSRGYCGWAVRRIVLLYVLFVSLYTCPTSPGHPVCWAESAARSSIVDPVHSYILSTETGARISNAYQAHLVPFYKKHGTPIVDNTRAFVVERVAPVVKEASKPVCDAVHRIADPYKEKAYAAYSTHAKAHVDEVRETACRVTRKYVVPAAIVLRDRTGQVVNEYIVPFSKSALNDYLIPLYRDHIQPRWNNQIKPALCRYSKTAAAYTRAHILPAIADGATHGYEVACDFTTTHVVPRAKRGAVHAYVFFKTHVSPPVRKVYDENLKEHVDRVVPWDQVEIVMGKLGDICSTAIDVAKSFTEEFYYMCYTIATGEEHPSVIARMKAEEALKHGGAAFAGSEGPSEDDTQIQAIARRLSGSARQWIQFARGLVGSAADNAKDKVNAYGRATGIYHRATKAVADRFAKTTAPVVQSTVQSDEATSQVAAVDTPIPSAPETTEPTPAAPSVPMSTISQEIPVAAEEAASVILEARDAMAGVLVNEEEKAAFEELVRAASDATERLEEFPSVLNDLDEEPAAATAPSETEATGSSATDNESAEDQYDDSAAVHVATTLPPQEPESAEETQQHAAAGSETTLALQKDHVEVKRDAPAADDKKDTRTAEVGSPEPIAVATSYDAPAIPASTKRTVTTTETVKKVVYVGKPQPDASAEPKTAVTTWLTETVKARSTVTAQVTTTVKTKATVTVTPVVTATVKSKLRTTLISEVTATVQAPTTHYVTVHAPVSKSTTINSTEDKESPRTVTTAAASVANERVDTAATESSTASIQDGVQETTEQLVEPSTSLAVEVETTQPAAANAAATVPASAPVEEALSAKEALSVEEAPAAEETVAKVISAATKAAPAKEAAADTTTDTVDDEVRKAASNWVKDARKSISREIAEERTRSTVPTAETDAADVADAADAVAENSDATAPADAASEAAATTESATTAEQETPASASAATPAAKIASEEHNTPPAPVKAVKSKPSKTAPKPKANKTEAIASKAEAAVNAEPAQESPVAAKHTTVAKRVKKPILDEAPAAAAGAGAKTSNGKGPRKIKKTKKRVVKKNQV